MASAFASHQAFDELRIDPYYRTVASRRPELGAAIDGFITGMQASHLCLVHGDYSPKNVLVGGGLWVIDFEVAHYGDPAFDVAFMLSHLLLKRLHQPWASAELGRCAEEFWGAYQGIAARFCPHAEYVLGHVGCLMVGTRGRQVARRLPLRPDREAARHIGSVFLLDPPDSLGQRAGTF